MNGGGYYRMHRGWMDHPMFKPEPYTEREAWLWLIENAAWKDGRKRVGPCTIEVKRGQVAASLRFMACAWKWNEPKVRRFLSRMKTDAAIDAASDAGVNVITICNYEVYQSDHTQVDAADDAANDAQPTQTRRKKEGKKNPPMSPDGGLEGKPAVKPAKGERSYSAEEQAGLKPIIETYPKRLGSTGWKDACSRMADIVAAGRATWDELFQITKAHAQQMAKAGKVGTDKVPMASTFFGDQKGYWSEALEGIRRSGSGSQDKVLALYRKALIDYRKGGTWDPIFGPLPRTPGCDIPAELINEILGPPPVVSRPTLTVVNA